MSDFKTNVKGNNGLSSILDDIRIGDLVEIVEFPNKSDPAEAEKRYAGYVGILTPEKVTLYVNHPRNNSHHETTRPVNAYFNGKYRVIRSQP